MIDSLNHSLNLEINFVPLLIRLTGKAMDSVLGIHRVSIWVD
jgi:hypothetical protein